MVKESSSFLKKRTKKLLRLCVRGAAQHARPRSKVFWFFFSKKNSFLPFVLLPRIRAAAVPPCFEASRPCGAEGY
jgi:hypothetical protein